MNQKMKTKKQKHTDLSWYDDARGMVTERPPERTPDREEEDNEEDAKDDAAMDSKKGNSYTDGNPGAAANADPGAAAGADPGAVAGANPEATAGANPEATAVVPGISGLNMGANGNIELHGTDDEADDPPTLRELKACRQQIDEIEAKVSMWLHETNSFTMVLSRLTYGEIDLLRRAEGIHRTIATLEDDMDLEPANSDDV